MLRYTQRLLPIAAKCRPLCHRPRGNTETPVKKNSKPQRKLSREEAQQIARKMSRTTVFDKTSSIYFGHEGPSLEEQIQSSDTPNFGQK